MNYLSSWSAKYSNVWRYFKPVKTHRFISTGRYLFENLETDIIEKFSEKKEKCVNEIKLLGRVGTDAVLFTKEGKTFAKFSLATNSYWKNDGDDQQKTEWHTILVFDPTLVGAAGKYIKKGQRLYISGKLAYSSDNNNLRKSAFISLQNFINISS